MARAIQLELDLWQQLEAATQQPERADLGQLWQGLEQAISRVPRPQRLPLAASAIPQIIEVFARKADLLLASLEVKNPTQGPVLSGDFLDGWLRQSMTVDLSDLQEEEFVLERTPWQGRSPGSEAGESVAGVIDKATLLEAFESEIELGGAQAIAASDAVRVAHEEDVLAWADAIALWLATQTDRTPVSLLELQQGAGITLVEVWLGLLLGYPELTLQQQGAFYDAQGISIGHLVDAV